jgi:prepilin-type N-terminal cleavage/methylation domain-containing protein
MFLLNDLGEREKGDGTLHVRMSGRGLTLLEMLLVLAVLAVAIVVLYPATERLYRTHRFRQAVEQIRARLAATRVRAIDEGVIYRFQYEPDGQRFLAIPHRQLWRTADDSNGRLENPNGVSSAQRVFGKLPRGMRFAAAEGRGERISRQQLDAFPDADELATVTWSKPVLFYPDGSSDDGEIPVTGGDDQFVRLSVRGLTGAARVVHDRSRRQTEDNPG